jgi:hypothetical protein
MQYLGSDLYSQGNYYGVPLLSGSDTIDTTITGGHTWAIKGLIEIPDWQRAGAEIIYGQVGSSMRENSYGKQVENEGGSFQEVRLYARYRHSDQLSITPVASWMPTLPLLRGQERMESTSNVWGFQLTIRSKFQL